MGTSVYKRTYCTNVAPTSEASYVDLTILSALLPGTRARPASGVRAGRRAGGRLTRSASP